MEHDVASGEAEAASRLWVPMSEAVRMIARFDGELLRSPDDIPPKAEVKLIEALRTGRVSSRGYYDAEGGTLKEIPLIDWQECEPASRRGWLRERLRRIPRFTNVEIDVADVKREFAPAMAALRTNAKASGKTKCQQWLVDFRLAGPPPKKKDLMFEEAREKYGVGRGQFDDAWSGAAFQAPNASWGMGGRPKKP